MNATTNTATTEITATVTEDCGDSESPRSWAEYVAERLRGEYPGATVSVSYGARNSAWIYSGTSAATIDEFGYLTNLWWDELCAQPNHEQWSHLPAAE